MKKRGKSVREEMEWSLQNRNMKRVERKMETFDRGKGNETRVKSSNYEKTLMKNKGKKETEKREMKMKMLRRPQNRKMK